MCEDKAAALTAFSDFIKSCIFIHDDPVDPSVDVDWDQHGTKPFLLGVDFCVTDGLHCFGEAYLNYLDEIGCLPKHIFVPSHIENTLIENMLGDTQVLQVIKDTIAANRLDISTFYGGEDEQKLAVLLSSEQFSPHLHPAHCVFTQVNSKIAVRNLLEKTDLPLPIGSICLTPSDLFDFCTRHRELFPRIALKRNHWDTTVFETGYLLEKPKLSIRFPIIVEGVYPNCQSPIAHCLVWKDKIYHLFTIQQDVRDFRHSGNHIPHKLSPDIARRIQDVATAVIELFPDYSGVAGIDFLVTPSGEVLIVDVNPRFNSSTYPFYFMTRLGYDLEQSFAKFGHLKCLVNNLSDVYLHDDFRAFSRGRGTILFSPNFDHTKGKITNLSYICVGRSAKELRDLEQGLVQLLTAMS